MSVFTADFVYCLDSTCFHCDSVPVVYLKIGLIFFSSMETAVGQLSTWFGAFFSRIVRQLARTAHTNAGNWELAATSGGAGLQSSGCLSAVVPDNPSSMSLFFMTRIKARRLWDNTLGNACAVPNGDNTTP